MKEISKSSRQPFSKRHSYSGMAKEICIWEDAPQSLRFHLLETAEELGWGPSALRPLICKTLHIAPDRDNWTEYPNIQLEVERLIYQCDWFKIYDVIEGLHDHLLENDERHLTAKAQRFEEAMNELFTEEGIGWQLRNGEVITRGTEVFEAAVSVAVSELGKSERPTAASRIDESLKALSRRPTPDLSGAISHAIAAMECVAGDVTGDSKATLGDYLKNHPALFGSLKKTIEGIWAYSCNEGARHGKEGRVPAREEAELIVSLTASVITYLNRKETKRCR